MGAVSLQNFISLSDTTDFVLLVNEGRDKQTGPLQLRRSTQAVDSEATTKGLNTSGLLSPTEHHQAKAALKAFKQALRSTYGTHFTEALLKERSVKDSLSTLPKAHGYLAILQHAKGMLESAAVANKNRDNTHEKLDKYLPVVGPDGNLQHPVVQYRGRLPFELHGRLRNLNSQKVSVLHLLMQWRFHEKTDRHLQCLERLGRVALISEALSTLLGDVNTLQKLSWLAERLINRCTFSEESVDLAKLPALMKAVDDFVNACPLAKTEDEKLRLSSFALFSFSRQGWMSGSSNQTARFDERALFDFVPVGEALLAGGQQIVEDLKNDFSPQVIQQVKQLRSELARLERFLDILRGQRLYKDLGYGRFFLEKDTSKPVAKTGLVNSVQFLNWLGAVQGMVVDNIKKPLTSMVQQRFVDEMTVAVELAKAEDASGSPSDIQQRRKDNQEALSRFKRVCRAIFAELGHSDAQQNFAKDVRACLDRMSSHPVFKAHFPSELLGPRGRLVQLLSPGRGWTWPKNARLEFDGATCWVRAWVQAPALVNKDMSLVPKALIDDRYSTRLKAQLEAVFPKTEVFGDQTVIEGFDRMTSCSTLAFNGVQLNTLKQQASSEQEIKAILQQMAGHLPNNTQHSVTVLTGFVQKEVCDDLLTLGWGCGLESRGFFYLTGGLFDGAVVARRRFDFDTKSETEGVLLTISVEQPVTHLSDATGKNIQLNLKNGEDIGLGSASFLIVKTKLLIKVMDEDYTFEVREDPQAHFAMKVHDFPTDDWA